MNIRALLIIYLINSRGEFADRNINEEIANSLIYVIERFFVPRGSSFIIAMSFERELTKYFYKDLSSILFRSYDDITTQISVNEGINAFHGVTGTIFNFIMFVVDSYKSFLNIDLANKVRNYDTNEFYHIFLHNKDRFLDDDIRNILMYCWTNYIINVNVAIQTAAGEIIVYTYFPFSELHCNEVIPVEINRFQNGTMVNPELFPSKLKNMNKCPVKLAPIHAPPFMSVDTAYRSAKSIDGFEGQLIRELSSLMNFTIDIHIPPSNEGRGLILENGSTTGAIDMLINRKADISLGFFWFTTERRQILTASKSYFQSTNVAVLVKNSLNYESPYVLWFPYEVEASVLIITSFFIMLTMVYILEKFLPVLSFKTIPRSKCLNFIAWTLGLPSQNLPILDSKRIFVMTWILFGLIIRSQYAGTIFHMLSNNLFRRSPTTIGEVKKLNYTIIVNSKAYNALRQTSVFMEMGLQCRVIDNEQYEKPIFVYLEENPQERIFALTPLGFLMDYVDANRKVDVLTTLRETFIIQNICIYFSKHSFLVDRVNLYLQRISSAGIIDFWIQRQFNVSYLMSPKRQREIVIGQRELKGIYYIWFGLMSLGVLVFCLEVLSKKFEVLRKIFNKI